MGLTNQSTGMAAIDDGISIHRKRETDMVLALAGNPNVGKSTVFNSLTGLRQHTGNWPGKTVSSAVGEIERGGKRYVLVDLPGCYSLAAHSAEEAVARDFIQAEEADAVLVVCDGTCLERSLTLVLEILQLTARVVVCVNLMDEAAKKHIQINIEELKRQLGVPVIGTAARKGKGLFSLLEAAEAVQSKTEKMDKMETAEMMQRAEEISRAAVQMPANDPMRFDRGLDKVVSGKVLAFPLMFLFLIGIFWLTIRGANYPSALLTQLFAKIESILRLWLCAAPPFVTGILLDGVWRVTATVVSVMLPPMAIFFPLFTLMEDVGLLPRIAFNLDRCFKKCKACGKQALTMCMGFGCNAAGVVGCRIMDSPRERLIAILTNSLVPCNGRFPMLITILSIFFAVGDLQAAVGLSALISLSVLATLFLSYLLSKTVLRGEKSVFILEMPPYRVPRVGHVIVRSLLDRTVFVLGRAIAAAAPAGLLIWCMANLTVGGQSLLGYCTAFLDPFAALMGLDGVILMAFILGIPANEMVMPIILMAYLCGGTLTDIGELSQLRMLLIQNGWTKTTALCTMLFSLFHWPCSTTLATIYRETQSRRYTWLAALLPTVLGVLCCMLVNFVMQMIA